MTTKPRAVNEINTVNGVYRESVTYQKVPQIIEEEQEKWVHSNSPEKDWGCKFDDVEIKGCTFNTDTSIKIKAGDHKGDDDADDDTHRDNRQTWGRKLEYFLSTIGFCVGMGNVLRFPYICIRNGGGIGISMNILSLMSAWYFSLIISLTLIYAVNAVKSPQPWAVCGQSWNSQFCVPPGGYSETNSTNVSLTGDVYMQATDENTMSNSSSTVSSSKEFWLKNVLELSSGLEDLNGLPWHTTLALFVAVATMFICIIKGVHSVGKVVYVTATLPYLLLTLLIIQGAMLPGAIKGVMFYIQPDFTKLALIQTWVEACIQVFSSLGPAYGGLITMASYNKFNNNCMRDAIVLSFVCEGTSLFAGFAIFTVLGHMAHTLMVPVSSFASTGPGLAFVVYPEAITYLPVPQFWGLLFFIMLFTVALDSQFTLVETVLTSFQDYWPRFMTKWNIHIKIGCAVLFFLACLPFATRGGMYLFQLVDWYFSVFTVIMIAILECIVVSWIYGADRFLDDLTLMLSRRPPYLFTILWRFVTPILLMVLLLTTFITYRPPIYEGYVYGSNAIVFGWFIGCVTFLPVPVYAVYILYKTEGSFLKRVKSTCQPSAEWCPGESSIRELYKRNNKDVSICRFRSPCSSS